MKRIYTITRKVNDFGPEHCDKCFTNVQDAIKYLRRYVANKLRIERKYGYRVLYLNVYKSRLSNTVFPLVIRYNVELHEQIIARYEVMVEAISLMESEKDFDGNLLRFT